MFKKYLLLIFSLLTTLQCLGIDGGPNDQYHIIKNFENDWYIYDESEEIFIPFIDRIQSSAQTHSAFIDLQKFKKYTLLAKSENVKGYLFADNQLLKELPAGEWIEVPLSTFTGNELMMSILGSGNITHKSLLIGSEIVKGETSSGIERSEILTMRRRLLPPFNNGYVIILTLVFLYTTVLSSTNPKAFGEYFSLGDLFITKIRDTRFLISKPLNRVNQAFVVLLSLATGLLYVLLAGRGLYLFNNAFQLNPSTSSSKFVLAFLIVSGVAYAFYILKYFFLSIMAQLFGIKKSVNVHYYKNIQFLLVLFLVLIVVLFVWYINLNPGQNFDSDLIFYVFLLTYLLRTTLSFFSILKSTGIQSLYLIAYLCVVEILPIVLGLRFAF
ncbi:DUF4271 domain-containing protein [Jiulongibacter sp. NS-SX5]|uniref:DUF4271 domain-containing protein n=1 Tax=Jiulongibacter sp. NS-SX5 TaxID=3463854 RepID=UPI004059BEF9